MVRKLKRYEILNIANNFIYSKHAIDRINERLNGNLHKVKTLIQKSTFSYINTDGSINVGFGDNSRYFVFVLLQETQKYLMITCKEPSGYTSLYKKYFLALNGYDRKECDKNEKL